MIRSYLLATLCCLFLLASVSAEAGTVTVWSENGASCVPTNSFGVNIAAGALTAGASTTVIAYCQLTKADTAGAINHIEITYKGQTLTGVNQKAELISMSKTTGAETVMGGITGTSSSVINTVNAVLSSSIFDWNNNFYYVRVTLTSGTGINQLQTLYGVSLTVVT